MAVVQRVHPLPKGWRVNRSYANHSNLPRAIDYGAPIGTPVFAAQNGVCAICSRPPGKRRLAVDHWHTTKAVRGLLCVQCNTAIGKLNDDPELLRRAIAYLFFYQ